MSKALEVVGSHRTRYSMEDSIGNLLGETDPVEQAVAGLRDLSVAPLTREEVYPVTEQQAPEPLPVPAAAENAVSEAERPTATTPDIFAAPSNALGSFDITPQLPEPIFGYQPPRLPDLQTQQRMRELREFEELRRLLEQNTLGLSRPTDRGVERLSGSVAAEFGFSDDIKIFGLPVADRGFLGNMLYYLGTPFRGANALVMDAQLGLIRGRAALEEAVMGGMSVGTREALRRFSQPNLSANPNFNGTNYAQEDTWLYRRLPNFMAASAGAFLSPLEGPTVSAVTGTNVSNLRGETFVNPWSNNFFGINPLVLPLAPAVFADEALDTNTTGSLIQGFGGVDVLPGASLEELANRGDTGYGLATNAPRFLGGGGGQRFDERGNRPILESVLGFADSVKAMTLNVGLEVLTPTDLAADALLTPLVQAGGNLLARAAGRAQQAGAASREASRVRVPASAGVGKPSTVVVDNPVVLDVIDAPYTPTKFLTGSEGEEFRMPFSLPPGPEPIPLPATPAPRMLGPGGAQAVVSFDEFRPVEVYERLPLDMLSRRDFDVPSVQTAPQPTMLDIALRAEPTQTPSTTLIPNIDFTNDVFADMTNQYTQAIDNFIVEQGLDRPASLIPGDFTVVDEFTAGVSRTDLDITDLVPAEARQAQLVRDFYANKPYKPPTIRIVAPVRRSQASIQAQVLQDVRRIDFDGVTVDVDAVTIQDFVRSANQGTTSSIDASIADELAKNINYNVVDDLIDGTRIPAPESILPNGQVRVTRLALPPAPAVDPLAGVPTTQIMPSSGRVTITPPGAIRKAPVTIDVVARTVVDTEETLESALKLRQQLDSGDWVAPAEKSMRELASRVGIAVGDKPTGVELFTQIGDYARRELENVADNTVKALTQKIKALGLRGYSGKSKTELIAMYGDGLRALGDFNPDRVPSELWTADGVTLRESKENAILDAQAAGLERVRQVQVNLANPRQRLVGIGSWSADGLTLTDIAEEAVAKLENPTAIKAAKAKVATKTAQPDATQATQRLNDQIIHENTQELTQSLTGLTRAVQAREAKAKQRALDNARASSKPKPRKEISFAQAKQLAETLYEDVATKLSEPGLRPAAVLAKFNSYADALREMLRSLPSGTTKEDLQELIADLAEARVYAVVALLDGAFDVPAVDYLTKADDLAVAVDELRNYVISVVPDTTPANAGVLEAALERIKELADFASQVRPKTTKPVAVVDPDAPSDITKLEGPDLPAKPVKAAQPTAPVVQRTYNEAYDDAVIVEVASSLGVTPEQVGEVLGKPYAYLPPDEVNKFPINPQPRPVLVGLIERTIGSGDRKLELLSLMQHISDDIITLMLRAMTTLVPYKEAVDINSAYYAEELATARFGGMFNSTHNVLYAGRSVTTFIHEFLHSYFAAYFPKAKREGYYIDTDLVSRYTNTVGAVVTELRKSTGYSEMTEAMEPIAARNVELARQGKLRADFTSEFLYLRAPEETPVVGPKPVGLQLSEGVTAIPVQLRKFRKGVGPYYREKYGTPLVVVAYIDSVSKQILDRPLGISTLLEDLNDIKEFYLATGVYDYIINTAFEEEYFNYIASTIPGVAEAFVRNETVGRDILDNLELNILQGKSYAKRIEASSSSNAANGAEVRGTPSTGSGARPSGDISTSSTGNVSVDTAVSGGSTTGTDVSARIAGLTERLDAAIAEGNMRKADAIQRQLDKLEAENVKGVPSTPEARRADRIIDTDVQDSSIAYSIEQLESPSLLDPGYAEAYEKAMEICEL